MTAIQKNPILIVIAGMLSLLMVIPADAVTKQEIIKMSRADISDDLIIKMIRRDNTIYDLEAEDVIHLKKNGVSERVIKAMLSTSTETAPGYDPYDQSIKSVSKSGTGSGSGHQGSGVVTIKNRDQRDYGIWVDRVSKTVIFGFRNSQAPIILKGSSSIGLRLPSGRIKFKWDGRDNYGDLTLKKNGEKQVSVSMKHLKNRFAFTMSVKESEQETIQTGLQTFYQQWFGPDPQPKHVAFTTYTAKFFKKRYHHPVRIFRMLHLMSATREPSVRNEIFKHFFPSRRRKSIRKTTSNDQGEKP